MLRLILDVKSGLIHIASHEKYNYNFFHSLLSHTKYKS